MALTAIGNIHDNEYKDVDLDSTPEVVSTTTDIFLGLSFDNSANDEAEYARGYDVSGNPTVGTTQPKFVAKVAKGAKRTYLANMGVGLLLVNGLDMACVEEPGTAGSSSPDEKVPSTIWTT